MRVAVKHLTALWLGTVLTLFATVAATLAATGGGGSVTASAGSFDPNPVCAGVTSTASLGASTSDPTPPPYCTLNSPTFSWSVSGASGVSVSQPDPSSAAATLRATISTPGTYSISATVTASWTDSCGNNYSASDTATLTLTGVGVQKLQYQQPAACGGGFVDVSGTLYARVGQSVTFKAVPTPSGSSFPSGQPVWSGTSGATGTGETVSVTFGTLSSSAGDAKTVTATCGSSSVTASVVVFDLTPVLTPVDNYEGRDLDAYGVCEFIDLSFRTTPAGLSAAQLGGLQWQNDDGGTLSGGAGGVGTYQCPDEAGTLALNIVILGGLACAQVAAAPAPPIVPPTGVFMTQKAGTGLQHEMGFVTVGFKGQYYATGPRNVSFAQIERREGTCNATATGYWVRWNNLPHMASASWYALGARDANGRYPSDSVDTVYTGKIDPVGALAVGTFRWPIPNMYRRRGGGGNGTEYGVANQNHDCTAAGTASAQKAGAGPFSKNLNDPNSTY